MLDLAPGIRHDKKPHDGARGHKGQQTWLDECLDKHSRGTHTVTIAVGRQIGKTTLVQFLPVEEAARCKTHYQAAYVAQGHPQATEFYELCLMNWEQAKIVKKARDKGQDRFIEIIPFGQNRGMKMYFWSGDADAHKGAAGKTLNRIVIDEASLVPEEAVTSTFRPMLNVTKGKMLVMGSPYPGGVGFDWFEKVWLWGEPNGDKKRPGYWSFSAPSECNPFSSDVWIAENRAMCRSKSEEMCQYDGLFSRDIGSVFKNLDLVFSIKPIRKRGYTWIAEDYIVGEHYVAGIDFGKMFDYTVVSIFHANSRRQVAVMRVQGDYLEQLRLIDDAISAYGHPTMWVEGREGGSVLNEMLRKRFAKGMVEVKWSRGGLWDKESNIIRGQDLCQQAIVKNGITWNLMNIPEQREEFRLFGCSPISPTNPTLRYGAPPGRHDDFVAAALYATYGMPIENYAFKNRAPIDKREIPWSVEWVADVRRAQGQLTRRNPFRI